MTPPLRAVVVRHGQTAWSLSGRHTGRTDIALSEEGRAEARSLRVRLSALRFSGVLTSPLSRATQTCELAGLGAGASVDPDLAEWNYGDFEGLVRSQIDAIKPGWNIFRDGCPGGETAADVSARADRVVARLRQGQGDYAVFTHGHFGRAFAARWLGFGLVEADRLLLATASVGILSFERGDRSCPAIELWNLPPDGALPRA